MRLLVSCLFVLAACQHADPAEKSAQVVAQVAPAAVVTAPEHRGCSGGGGEMCGGGQCSGQCGGESPTFATPDSASWTALHVTGMHCGGCARRIERALAGVNGVLGVKADYAQAKVEVATAAGVDARKLVGAAIDNLGYHVE